jgi:hypothetical protein
MKMYSDDNVTKEYVDNAVLAATVSTTRSVDRTVSQIDAKQTKSINGLKFAVIALTVSSILLWTAVIFKM